MPSVSVWIVSSQPTGAGQWRRLLESEGWTVTGASDLRALLDAVGPHQVGMAVIDWTSLAPAPARSVKAVKERAPNLALVLTSQGDLGSERTIELLEAGIDDYVTHTTPPGLVLAKLRAHARRIVPNLASEQRAIKSPKGDLKMDLARRDVWMRQSGKWVNRSDLTAIEMKLLAVLLERPGVAVERRFILETLWKDKGEDVRPGTIDKHVEALRKKLGRVVGGRIKTVYGVGYVYRE